MKKGKQKNNRFQRKIIIPQKTREISEDKEVEERLRKRLIVE